MLQKIHSSGMTDNQIAQAISGAGHKISQPVIHRLRKGTNKRTFYERYEAIKTFYENSLKKTN